MSRLCLGWMILALGAISAGCATNVVQHVDASNRVTLKTTNAGSRFTLVDGVPVRLESGLRVSTLVSGSSWVSVGTVPQGIVYRSTDSVVSVGYGFVEEAYIVVDESSLQGLFLPARSAFLKASAPHKIRIGGER